MRTYFKNVKIKVVLQMKKIILLYIHVNMFDYEYDQITKISH